MVPFSTRGIWKALLLLRTKEAAHYCLGLRLLESYTSKFCPRLTVVPMGNMTMFSTGTSTRPGWSRKGMFCVCQRLGKLRSWKEAWRDCPGGGRCFSK